MKRTLNAHLHKTEAHDGLPFHPGCPICRQTRAIGRLPSDGVVSRRAQAVLAAGVLVVSTGAPITPALAAGEPDQEQQGGAPIAANGGDSAANPDFDPGGDTTDLPEAALLPAVQAPVDADDDDAATVEQEPSVDQRETVVDAGDGTEPVTNEAASTSPTQSLPAPTDDSAKPTSPNATPLAPSEPSAQEPVSTPVVRADARPAKRRAPRARHRRQEKLRTQLAPSTAVRPSTASSPAPVRTVVVSGAHAASAPAARGHIARHPARPGDRSHTVEAGESLWTIATDVLRHDATAAQVAREVHRLWSLNRERIATGDPDLLPVGTTLVLR